MTRAFTQVVADIADVYPLGLFGIILTLLLLALILGLVLQPRGLLRLRLRRKTEPVVTGAEVVMETEADPDEELPQLPVDELRDRALRFAAAGRYDEAVREWLRVMARDLVDRAIIEHYPGWTVTELAGAAGTALPDGAHCLHEGANVFSEIWYGQRPATMESSTRMRALADELAALVANRQPVTTITLEAR